MRRSQFVTAAVNFLLADTGAPFEIFPEQVLGERRFHVIFTEPQDALGPSCEILLDFLDEFLDEAYPVAMGIEFKLDLSGVEQYAYHLNRWFDGHEAAGLEEASVLRANHVRDRRGVRRLLDRFVEDRNTVLERYGQADERYRRVSEIRITIGSVGAAIGDNALAGLEQHRSKHRVRQIEAPYGDCLWKCILKVLDRASVKRRGGKIWLPEELASVNALIELCGLSELRTKPVCLEHQELIAERLLWRLKDTGPLRGVRLYLYDLNLKSAARPAPAARVRYQ